MHALTEFVFNKASYLCIPYFSYRVLSYHDTHLYKLRYSTCPHRLQLHFYFLLNVVESEGN